MDAHAEFQARRWEVLRSHGRPVEGALLEAPCRGGKIVHMAVLVGEDEVIHFNGEGGEESSVPSSGCKPRVISELLEDFGRQYPQWRVSEVPRDAEHAQKVVGRARAHLDEEGYNVVWRNCQHFATECFHGSASSTDVQGARVSATLVGGTTAAAAGGVGGVVANTATTVVVTTAQHAVTTYPWFFGGWTKQVITMTYTIHPLFTAGQVAGVVAVSSAGAAVLGTTTGVGLHLWGKSRIAARLPIGVYNALGSEVDVALKDDNGGRSVVHFTSFWEDTLGHGLSWARVAADGWKELNPASWRESFLLEVRGASHAVRRGDIVVLQPGDGEAVVFSTLAPPHEPAARGYNKEGHH